MNTSLQQNLGIPIRRFDELQALRAIAAGMVVLEHALLTYNAKVSAVNYTGSSLFELGDFGVRLFFCISGFIIFISAAKLMPGVFSAANFAVRRLIRIVPLYWCATLIYALKLSFQGAPPTFEELLYSLLFIPYLAENGLMRPILGAGWTLNFEMFFYAVLALSILLDRRMRLLVVSAALLALLASRAWGLFGPQENIFGNALFLLAESYLLFFVVGMVIGYFADAKVFTLLARIPSHLTLWILLLMAFGGSVAIHSLALAQATSIAMQLALCTFCVLLCVHCQSNTSRAEPNLFQRTIVLAGDGSYSTYLTHGFVMGPAARVVGALNLGIAPWLFSIAMVFACTAVGMCLYRYFEYPLLKNLNERWRKFSGGLAFNKLLRS
jgi:exopolysaccharide production protein ExoZ